MTRSLPNLNRTPDEIPLAECLGRESRERITNRIRLGVPSLASVKIEADHIAKAWAHYDDKVQIRAIQIAFEVLHHSSPNEAG
jgi:hypothetical protein